MLVWKKVKGLKTVLTEEQFADLRHKMVNDQIIARGIHDSRLLDAMRVVPRHRFVPMAFRRHAYQDAPLPIGQKQTISQPYIVALMTQMLELRGGERVLEIGTGCGYQTAVLCEMADYVYTLERFPRLADAAGRNLQKLGYDNLDIHIGDGSQGLPDMSPFDAIIVTAAAPSIPGPLASQMSADGGRLVVPVGTAKSQYLYIVRRFNGRHQVERAIPVRFVPLMGRYGFKEKPGRGGSSPASV